MPDALSDSYSLTLDEVEYLKKSPGFLTIHPRDVSQSLNDQVCAKKINDYTPSFNFYPIHHAQKVHFGQHNGNFVRLHAMLVKGASIHDRKQSINVGADDN